MLQWRLVYPRHIETNNILHNKPVNRITIYYLADATWCRVFSGWFDIAKTLRSGNPFELLTAVFLCFFNESFRNN